MTYTIKITEERRKDYIEALTLMAKSFDRNSRQHRHFMVLVRELVRAEPDAR